VRKTPEQRAPVSEGDRRKGAKSRGKKIRHDLEQRGITLVEPKRWKRDVKGLAESHEDRRTHGGNLKNSLIPSGALLQLLKGEESRNSGKRRIERK